MSFVGINQNFLVTGMILDQTDGSTVDISGMIEDVMVRKKYTTNAYPLFVIDLKTTQDLRDKMRDHDIKLSLRISTYDASSSEENDNSDDQTVVETGVMFEGIIRIYDKPFVTTSAKKDEDDSEEGENQTKSAPFLYYRLSGIPEDLITKNEKIINKIFSNANLSDIAVNLLSDINPQGNIFIQEPDNTNIYKSILIPPLNIIPALQYLDNYYGFYNGNACIFFDIDRLYFYDPFSNDITFENTFNVVVKSIDNTSESISSSIPMYDADTNNLKIIMKNLPPFSTANKLVGDGLGSNTIYYSYDDNFNIITRNSSNDSFYTKTRYLWNSANNKKDEDYHSMINSKSSSMNLSLSNINPELITPLTLFNVDTDYSLALGDYVLLEKSYIISTNDMTHYNCITNLSLLKR